MTRRVAIISPHFPPSCLAGVHRARHLANHLPEHGWVPSVFCFHEQFHTERLDPRLATLVRSDALVHKVNALPHRRTSWAGIGDITLRGWLSMRRALAETFAIERHDLALITGGPYYTMMLAPWIRRRFGIPVVLDFQDPWVNSWGKSQPPLSKARAAYLLSTILEPYAVKPASHVTSVSAIQNQQLLDRYDNLLASQVTAIPIGIDEADFDGIGAEDEALVPFAPDPDKFRLVYVGAFWPRVTEAVRQTLLALRAFASAYPDAVAKLEVWFVGTDATLSTDPPRHIQQMADDLNIGYLVHEAPSRLPYLSALATMKAANALLLIGSDEAHYTASKIYPALTSRQPFLSLFHEESSAHKVLAQAGNGMALGYPSYDTLSTMTEQIAGTLQSLMAGKVDPANPDILKSYMAPEIARQFAEVFDRLVGAQ